MSMYEDDNPFADFEFQLDDFLVWTLIEQEMFRKITGEQYAIIRATVRSEILYSEEIAAVVRPYVGKFVDRVRGIPDLHFKVPGGLSLYGAGGSATDVVAAAAPGGEERARFGPGRATMYRSTFVGFDDILVERWLPAQQVASMEPAELVAFASLVKGQLLFSEKVHDHLRRRVAETFKEITKG